MFGINYNQYLIFFHCPAMSGLHPITPLTHEAKLLYLLLDWLFIELIKICRLLMYTAHDDKKCIFELETLFKQLKEKSEKSQDEFRLFITTSR